MSASTSAMARAGETAMVALALVEDGTPGALSKAIAMVFADVMAEASFIPPLDLSECATPVCPAVTRAGAAATAAAQHVIDVVTFELLVGNVVMLRRLVELENKPAAEIVRGFVADLKRGAY